MGHQAAAPTGRNSGFADVATRQDRPDHLKWIKFSSAAWTHDGAGFFYSRYPEPTAGTDPLLEVNHNQKVYYHKLSTDQSADRLVYDRPDHPDWGFGVEVSADGRYAVYTVWLGTDRRNRIYYQDLGDPTKPRLDAPVVRLLAISMRRMDSWEIRDRRLLPDRQRSAAGTDRRRRYAPPRAGRVARGRPASARRDRRLADRAQYLRHSLSPRRVLAAAHAGARRQNRPATCPSRRWLDRASDRRAERHRDVLRLHIVPISTTISGTTSPPARRLSSRHRRSRSTPRNTRRSRSSTTARTERTSHCS